MHTVLQTDIGFYKSGFHSAISYAQGHKSS